MDGPLTFEKEIYQVNRGFMDFSCISMCWYVFYAKCSASLGTATWFYTILKTFYLVGNEFIDAYQNHLP